MKKTFLFLIMTLCVVVVYHTLFAHEGEPHGEENATKTEAVSDELAVKKETQFLFDVFTAISKQSYFSDIVTLYGKVIPTSNGMAEIVAPQNGTIVTVNAKVGDRVEQGQIIAVVEQILTVNEKIQIATDENNIEKELRDAKNDVERLTKISHIVAKKDLINAEVRYRTAVENKRVYDQMRSKGNGNKLLSYIKAPITGVIDNYTLSPGSTVQQGQVLLRVVNIHKVWVEVQVFEDDVNQIKNAKKFVVESSLGEDTNTVVKLVSLGQTVNQANQSLRAVLEISNANQDFRPGQVVNVKALTAASTKQIVVPTSAITDIGGKPVVFTHTSPEVFHINFVSTGESDEKNTVILKGLHENERVVISGSYQLKSIVLSQ